MKILRNKKNHIDARNALGIWSTVKLFIDFAMVIGGGGILAHMPDVQIFSLVFILWIWTLIKEVGDFPLVIIWLYGKINHRWRKYKRRKRREARCNKQSGT